MCDNHPVEPPAGAEHGYHLSEDLVDRLLAMIADSKGVRPDRPGVEPWAGRPVNQRRRAARQQEAPPSSTTPTTRSGGWWTACGGWVSSTTPS